MSNTIPEQLTANTDRERPFGKVLVWGLHRGMLSITNLISPRVSSIVSEGTSMSKERFSEMDIDSISVTEWKRRYKGYVALSWWDVIGQEHEDAELNWWALVSDNVGTQQIQSFQLSDTVSGSREMYELLTILKLLSIHGSIALHQSSPIQITRKMLWLLRAHGLTWRFEKKQWNETGVYIFTK